MAKPDEMVLVIPTSRFEAAGIFHGFKPFDPDYQAMLLPTADLAFRSRAAMEIDPNFKQLIPYVILQHGDTIFEYVRGTSGGETRLHRKRSIGIGGHISADDSHANSDPYRTGMLRELHEEVLLETPFTERLLGFIYDGRTPVGEVHLGIVHLLTLAEPKITPREAGIADARLTPIAEFPARMAEFETWSQFALEALMAQTSGK